MNHKQVWKRLLIAFGGLLLVWLLVVLVFDIGPVDDSDLALPEREVDPAQNPFPELRDLAFSDEEMEELFQVSMMFSGSGPMDEALLEDLLERHAPTLERFDRYAVMKEWKEYEPPLADTEYEYLVPCLRLSTLKMAEAALLASDGKPDEAIDLALTLLSFAIGLKTAEVPLLHGVVAEGIATNGYRTLDALIEMGLPSASLERLARRLDQLADDDDYFDTVIRAEYLYSKVNADRLPNLLRNGPVPSRFPGWVPDRLIYKSNRAHSMTVDFYRAALGSANGDRQAFDRELSPHVPSGKKRFLIMLLTGNGLSFEAALNGVRVVRPAFTAFFAGRTHLALLRLRVAFERYRLDRGDWPADLAELVPAYIKEIPTDPMDGKPLRYNAESRVIYSVGTDYIDDGGVSSGPHSLGSSLEIAIKLEPSTPMPWPDFKKQATTPE